MESLFKKILASGVIILLTACGGGGGGGGGNAAPPPVLEGVFLDSAVIGLAYRTATRYLSRFLTNTLTVVSAGLLPQWHRDLCC